MTICNSSTQVLVFEGNGHVPCRSFVCLVNNQCVQNMYLP